MRVLVLLRHGMTEANERRIYCGSTDLPLSDDGRAMAREIAAQRPLPACELYVTSGMVRADETLEILTGHKADRVMPAFSEMDFGRFEMLGYETLRHDPDYQRWINDTGGGVPCPGGESTGAFRQRVRSGGNELLEMQWKTALVVCHGGVIVNLMEGWFPLEARGFYEWQPAACKGWRVLFDHGLPIRFEPI
ncbi:MAG: histidine phosphatase family protein [Clostridia bacterium]|nr:histidine phosphatase family protein [Clostridia bacterium]